MQIVSAALHLAVWRPQPGIARPMTVLLFRWFYCFVACIPFISQFIKGIANLVDSIILQKIPPVNGNFAKRHVFANAHGGKLNAGSEFFNCGICRDVLQYWKV